MTEEAPRPGPQGGLRRFFAGLGPGIITGAADDDPSGISTYSVAGASFGFSTLWTPLLSVPLMAVVQLMCARLGLVTGQGLAANIRRRYSRRVLWLCALLLVVANVVNIAADLGGMATAMEMMTGIQAWIWTPIVAFALLALLLWTSYHTIARVFKWLTLTLFAYIFAAFLARPNWGQVLLATVLPRPQWSSGYLAIFVAIMGTTISPYLFFWQAAEEVEEERDHGRRTVHARRGATIKELRQATTDVLAGMGWAGVVMYFIILTTGATLFVNGHRDIGSAREAAEALRPLAGDLAYLLFTLGLVGTGMLGVPVLAGSSAYAITEAMHWRGSLSDRPQVAPRFYAVLAAGLLIGLALEFLRVNPIRMLFLAAVVNGTLAPPLIVVLTRLTSDPKVMGEHVNPAWMRRVGWLTAGLMGAAATAMFATWGR